MNPHHHSSWLLDCNSSYLTGVQNLSITSNANIIKQHLHLYYYIILFIIIVIWHNYMTVTPNSGDGQPRRPQGLSGIASPVLGAKTAIVTVCVLEKFDYLVETEN